MTITLDHYLVLSALIFSLGILCMVTKRNAIGILIGVELVLNAAALNFVGFWRYLYPGETVNGQVVPTLDGFAFTMFIIVLAAAEAAVALAIFLNFYNNFASIDVEQADELKG